MEPNGWTCAGAQEYLVISTKCDLQVPFSSFIKLGIIPIKH